MFNLRNTLVTVALGAAILAPTASAADPSMGFNRVNNPDMQVTEGKTLNYSFSSSACPRDVVCYVDYKTVDDSAKGRHVDGTDPLWEQHYPIGKSDFMADSRVVPAIHPGLTAGNGPLTSNHQTETYDDKRIESGEQFYVETTIRYYTGCLFGINAGSGCRKLSKFTWVTRVDILDNDNPRFREVKKLGVKRTPKTLVPTQGFMRSLMKLAAEAPPEQAPAEQQPAQPEQPTTTTPSTGTGSSTPTTGSSNPSDPSHF